MTEIKKIEIKNFNKDNVKLTNWKEFNIKEKKN